MSYTTKVQEYLKDVDLLDIEPTEIAAQCQVTVQELYLYLKYTRTSWLKLVTAERKARCAAELERNPEAKMDDLTEVCGYCDRNSMQRAFQRWHGMSFRDFKLSSGRV